MEQELKNRIEKLRKELIENGTQEYDKQILHKLDTLEELYEALYVNVYY